MLIRIYIRCLDDHRNDLEERIHPEDICEELYSLGVLNDASYQEYRLSSLPRQRRNRQLLDRIPAEPNGFLGLLLALSNHHRYAVPASAIWTRYRDHLRHRNVEHIGFGRRERIVEAALYGSQEAYQEALRTFPSIDVRTGAVLDYLEQSREDEDSNVRSFNGSRSLQPLNPRIRRRHCAQATNRERRAQPRPSYDETGPQEQGGSPSGSNDGTDPPGPGGYCGWVTYVASCVWYYTQKVVDAIYTTLSDIFFPPSGGNGVSFVSRPSGG